MRLILTLGLSVLLRVPAERVPPMVTSKCSTTTRSISVIALGSPKTLNDLTNIDFSALEQGAVLIYDETSGLWKAKADMDDGTRIEGGHY